MKRRFALCLSWLLAEWLVLLLVCLERLGEQVLSKLLFFFVDACAFFIVFSSFLVYRVLLDESYSIIALDKRRLPS